MSPRRRPLEGIDWIVVLQNGLRFHCRRCGRSHGIEMPAPLSIWLAASRAFIDLHRGCRET